MAIHASRYAHICSESKYTYTPLSQPTYSIHSWQRAAHALGPEDKTVRFLRLFSYLVRFTGPNSSAIIPPPLPPLVSFDITLFGCEPWSVSAQGTCSFYLYAQLCTGRRRSSGERGVCVCNR